jgi:hypothetical protein
VPIMYTLMMRDPLEPELDLDAELAEEPLGTIGMESKEVPTENGQAKAVKEGLVGL